MRRVVTRELSREVHIIIQYTRLISISKRFYPLLEHYGVKRHRYCSHALARCSLVLDVLSSAAINGVVGFYANRKRSLLQLHRDFIIRLAHAISKNDVISRKNIVHAWGQLPIGKCVYMNSCNEPPVP